MNITDQNVISKNKGKIMNGIKSLFGKFNGYFVVFIISILCGVWIGVSKSTTYYETKMSESITAGGMVYQSRLYTIAPR